MIFFCDDDQDVYIGVCSVDTAEEKIIKKVAKIIGLDFAKSTSIPDDMDAHATLAFEVDTIMVNSKDYNEDFAELSDYGIAIYIIP